MKPQIPERVGFLVKRGGGGVAHIWDGKDSACRMYSTGGLPKRKYAYAISSDTRRICRNCVNVLGHNPADELESLPGKELPPVGGSPHQSLREADRTAPRREPRPDTKGKATGGAGLKLTAEELEAISVAVEVLESGYVAWPRAAATLRGLLRRGA